MKQLCLNFISCLIYVSSFSQTIKEASLFEIIQAIDKDSKKSNLEKLKTFYSLKIKIANNKPLNDSAYILTLLKISKYEFRAQKQL